MHIESVCENPSQEFSADGLVSEGAWESDLSGHGDLRPEEERLQGEGERRRVQWDKEGDGCVGSGDLK